MSLFLIFSCIVAGFVALYFMMKPKPFHVFVAPMEISVLGINVFPLLVFMMSLLPDKMRKASTTKQNAPKPGNVARDLYDIAGKTPYKIEEIKPGKIWNITYTFEDRSLTDKEAKAEAKAFGIDPTSDQYQKKCLDGASQFGEKAVEVAKKDLETAKMWCNKETVTNEELIEACNSELGSFVVKLNTGSVLLYAPVRIREEVGFGSWLDSIGTVEWIVVASSYHTLHIQNIAERYPNAKIIGPPAAEDKLNFVNALVRKKFDYNCTDENDLKAANLILAKEGVKLFYVDGDIACNTVLAIAHDVALECDIIYGHHDGEGYMGISKERFRDFKPEEWSLRLFRFALMTKPNAPHGSLATYRYQMMDPNSLGAMGYDQAARDGSTCRVMANSLRKMVMLEFESAAGVHIGCQNREDFRKNVDVNWNWLDGQTLL